MEKHNRRAVSRTRRTHQEAREQTVTRKNPKPITPTQRILLQELANRGRRNWHPIRDIAESTKLPGRAVGISLKGLWTRNLVDMRAEKELTASRRRELTRRYCINQEGANTLQKLKEAEQEDV
jgi:hypothetical protein